MSTQVPDLQTSLNAQLRGIRVLLVIDSCEHLIDAVAGLIESLLRAVPGISVLCTSREPLRSDGEQLHRLETLAVPAPGTVLQATDALGYAAIELFVERAKARIEGFELEDRHVSPLIALCRRLDGLPLAIEFAAARIDLFGIEGLASRLDDCFHLLAYNRRTTVSRHRTLQALLDWSHGLLAESEQITLRRLAVFRNSFSLATAVAVVADEKLSATDVIAGVTGLAEKSMATVDISGDVTRYRLYETTGMCAAPLCC